MASKPGEDTERTKEGMENTLGRRGEVLAVRDMDGAIPSATGDEASGGTALPNGGAPAADTVHTVAGEVEAEVSFNRASHT